MSRDDTKREKKLIGLIHFFPSSYGGGTEKNRQALCISGGIHFDIKIKLESFFSYSDRTKL